MTETGKKAGECGCSWAYCWSVLDPRLFATAFSTLGMAESQKRCAQSVCHEWSYNYNTTELLVTVFHSELTTKCKCHEVMFNMKAGTLWSPYLTPSSTHKKLLKCDQGNRLQKWEAWWTLLGEGGRLNFVVINTSKCVSQSPFICYLWAAWSPVLELVPFQPLPGVKRLQSGRQWLRARRGLYYSTCQFYRILWIFFACETGVEKGDDGARL